MTEGMMCGQTENCLFYKAVAGEANSEFNHVINSSKGKYYCTAMTLFIQKVSEGPARLSGNSLSLLSASPLECGVISAMNKKESKPK
jgi:hypothetical protein